MLVFRANGCESGRRHRPLHTPRLLGLSTQVRQSPRASQRQHRDV